MSSIWGNNIKVVLFGESHGAAIGCVLDNLPSGIKLDLKKIDRDLMRRSAQSYRLATPRKEKDAFEIVSGFFNGYTTGTPLCALIKNEDTRSRDYTPEILRPGHADYTAYERYDGFQDYRGGGHFSGRLTAPLVIAGSIAAQVVQALEPEVRFGSRIVSVGKVEDPVVPDWQDYASLSLNSLKYPVITEDLIQAIEEEVTDAMAQGDSVGGVIEAWVTGLPAGLGNPFFDSVESELASLLFSVPAVKGVEFGLGFKAAQKRGSEVNDAFRIQDGHIYTSSNNNGGINGGITNGMPVVLRVAIKPTPTIRSEQQTVDFKRKENITHSFGGRHDPCIVLRAPVVIEAVCALGILNLLGRR